MAAGRILNLLNADADVTCICPTSGLNPEVRHRIAHNQVHHIDRVFQASDLDTPCPALLAQPIAMVLTAVDDPIASTEVYKLCQQKRIPANIADVPPECDFYFGSVHRDGPLQVMVSTNGNGPKLAALVRQRIATNLPYNIGDAIRQVGLLRRRLRRMVPAAEEGPKRMKWMSGVCETWSLEELCSMDERDMKALLRYYGPNQIPLFDDVRLRDDGFDGSFGWSCVV